jgi:hypothetical protein
MTLHEEFYELRRKVWEGLETLVHTGCDFIGEFPIVIGEIKTKHKIIQNTQTIVIRGIIKDEKYSLHRGADLIIGTNTIKVKVYDCTTNTESIRDVEPDDMDLQELATYLSGGFKAYPDSK